MGSFLRKYNTATAAATHVSIPIVKRAVVDFAVGADWTPAAGDVKVTKDGDYASAANIATLPTAKTHGNTALWEFQFSAAELTCKKLEVTVADAATKAVEDQCFIIETFGNASAMYPFDLSVATQSVNVTQVAGTGQTAGDIIGDTNDIQARLPAALVSGRMDAEVSAAGFAQGAADKVWSSATRTLTSFGTLVSDVWANSTRTLTALGSGLVAEIWGALTSGMTTAGSIGKKLADWALGSDNRVLVSANAHTSGETVAAVTGAVGSVTGNVSGNVTGSVGSVAAGGITAGSIADGAIDRAALAADTGLQTVRSGTAQSGAASSITLDSGASATDDFYNECWIFITGGTGTGQARAITDYVGATKAATVTPNWVTNPDVTSAFAILPVSRNDAISAGATDWSTAEKQQIRQALGVDGTKSATSGGNLDTVQAAVDTEVAAIKAKTDQLNFTGTDVKATLDGETVTLAAAVHTGATIPTVTDVTNLHASAATAANQTTILNRIGAFTGSGLNTILGFLRALMRKDATLTPSDVGGTYDNTTDSQEAIKDNQLDVAIGTRSTLDAAGVRSAVGLAAANLDTQLSTIAGYIDTEVSAILAAVDTEVAAIKAKTDSLTFTVAGKADVTVAGYASGQDPATLLLVTPANKLLTDANGRVTVKYAIRKNTALSNFTFFLALSSDHVTPATGKSPTAQVALDGGSFATIAGAVTEMTNGFYKCHLTAAELNANVVAVKITVDATVDQRNLVFVTESD